MFGLYTLCLCTAPVVALVAELVVAQLAGGQVDKRGLVYLLVDSSVHGMVAAATWTSGLLWATLIADRTNATRQLFRDLTLRVPACPSPTFAFACSMWAAHGWVAQTTAACAILACLLDIDHFLMGWWNTGSLSLTAAMHLTARPIGHSVGFVLGASLLAAVILPRSPLWLLIGIAWGTHQLRDALRRGLWLWPIPLSVSESTPPLPVALYLLVLAAAGVGTGATLVWLGAKYIPVGGYRGESAVGMLDSAPEALSTMAGQAV